MKNLTIVQEVRRKMLHIGVVLYPILYNLVSYRLAVILSASVVIVDIMVETLRLLYPSINRKILKIFSGMYREKEKENVSTLIWTLSGAFLTILLFSDNKKIVTLSLLYLTFGDSIAAIIGVMLGRVRVGSRNKSLEGSIAFFIIAFLCGLFFFNYKISFLGALVASAIEFLPLPIDDNFLLPIITAGVLSMLI